MTRLEVEAKIQVSCNSIDSVRSRLLALGAEKIEERIEEDLYLAHPCRSFQATDEALRIRFVNGKLHKLTYKGPRLPGEVKARPEIEAPGNEELIEILEKLGFHPAYRVVKHREYYKLRETTITLDRVEELGCFVEIEAGNSQTVESTIQILGLSGQLITKSYLELLLMREDRALGRSDGERRKPLH